MNLRLTVAVALARLAGWASRLSGRGGSSLPGLVARRIYPGVLRDLSSRLKWGTALITGTNGKTTTAAIVRRILAASGQSALSNRAGANLILGLTAAFTEAPWRPAKRAFLALLETDEATMPQAGKELKPRVVTVTNFFRDQLDRYGELSTTVAYVRRGIEGMAEEAVLVLNADDPQVAALDTGERQSVFFGLNSLTSTRSSSEDAMDARFCPHCGSNLLYHARHYAHLGHYQCPHCGWARPAPQVLVERWDQGRELVWIRINGEEHELSWRIPGLYNLYNLAAAVSTGLALNIPPGVILGSLREFKPAFGRMESLWVKSVRMWLALVKNPVGFNQVLAMVAENASAGERAIMVLINDRYADGQDVSWLWDVDFEHWVEALGPISWFVGGIRARDMAVRLKYAGVQASRVVVEENIPALLDRALSDLEEGTLYVLPTYTAMLEVRRQLTQRGLAPHFREG